MLYMYDVCILFYILYDDAYLLIMYYIFFYIFKNMHIKKCIFFFNVNTQPLVSCKWKTTGKLSIYTARNIHQKMNNLNL